MSDDTEVKRILEMVENGTISAAEGARLLDTARGPSTAERGVTCPFCAETIPAQERLCPECGSDLQAPPTRSTTGHGFQSLSGLGKFLVVYTLMVAGLELLGLFFSFGIGALATSLLSVLGLIAGIMILKGNSRGWGLGILWSALQIICVILRGEVINQQIFHLGITHHVNGQGLGFNLVGVILLILFIKAKPRQ